MVVGGVVEGEAGDAAAGGEDAAALLGWKKPDWRAKPGPDHVLAAIGAAGAEAVIVRCANRLPYDGNDLTLATTYLEQLVGRGYELSKPELDFVKRCEKAAKKEEKEGAMKVKETTSKVATKQPEEKKK